MWLVVGLGNPGPEYARSRHNLGFMVADDLAERAGSSSDWRSKLGAQIAEIRLGPDRALLCKPQEYMNLSGEAAGRVSAFWKIDRTKLVAVYDELDLPFGRLKLASGGGAGGHNGVRSMIATLGPDFARVRMGIGKPPGKQEGANWVLGGFSKEEQKELPFLITEAREAVEVIVGSGMTTAMNRFNAKKPAGEKP
jgi:PTH1 family peptidyl-tRNA hydrolase